MEGNALIAFKLTPQEQEDLRWYMEDYVQHPEAVEEEHIKQIEAMMRQRGEELYGKVLAANRNTQAIGFAIREKLVDLRIEINTGISEAAAIPWELMRDPESDSALAVRVKAFVRVQSTPNIPFVPVPPAEDGRIRLLYVACRPGGTGDVALRAVANRLLQGLEQAGKRQQFNMTALRPPTYEALQKTLAEAKQAGRPFHIVHFDGHGVYADLSQTRHAVWLNRLGAFKYGGKIDGKHGYLLFEQPLDEDKIQPVPGEELGKLLHDHGVPVLVLNACQSAMHTADANPSDAETVHDEVRAIGSLAQAVVDQGIPAVLGMRYSVFVVTAAQYIGELYAALAQGQSFGEAATLARRHLRDNPGRWAGLGIRPLPDWMVPVVYEAMRLKLPETAAPGLGVASEPDPVLADDRLRLRYPAQGFIGRDETLLMLDRAFDEHQVVLLHAYAGQGKTSAAVEFARWYAQTGGLSLPSPAGGESAARGAKPTGGEGSVLLTSFEIHVDLEDALNQLAHHFKDIQEAHGLEWHTVKPDEHRPLALQLLRRYPLLWIWENVEPVAGFPAGNESAWTNEEQAELADFLKQLRLDQSTQVKLLLTSRRDEQAWLGGIPHRVKMPPMSRADSAALALAYCKASGWKHMGDWGPLLDYCAGNPLTLRVLSGQAIRLGLHGREPVAKFIQAVRDGEQAIEDADEAEGRSHSLGASLAYGFHNAFTEEELPVIALLSLFQGVVDVDVLMVMKGKHTLDSLKAWDENRLSKLLDRVCDAGFLTSIYIPFYSIHPSVPWFLLQVFTRYFSMQYKKVEQIWVEAIGDLSNNYHRKFNRGNRKVIEFLNLQEANLLKAWRLAYREGWLELVIDVMQGLRVLYEYQGRNTEWARLVENIIPAYCLGDDTPVPGREEEYTFVMDYRIRLFRRQEHNLNRAAALQTKRLEWDRRCASSALDVPENVQLNALECQRIRNLAMSIGTLGQILSEQSDIKCINCYEETIHYCRRIGNTAAEAISYLNLGHAYKNVYNPPDLDAAEAAYRRSLELRDTQDALGRSGCLQQIGLIYFERLKATSLIGDHDANYLKYIKTNAENYYLDALKVCPSNAIARFGSLYQNLGSFYHAINQTESAQKYYIMALHYYEQSGNLYDAGSTRYFLALMYEAIARRENPSSRLMLKRARAYAEHALSDFSHYQVRAASEEAQTQQLIADIDHALAESQATPH